MGGSVEVESKLGYGSRFIVTLQLKAKDKKLQNEEFMSPEDVENAYKVEGAFNFTNDFESKFKKIDNIVSLLQQNLRRNQDSISQNLDQIQVR